MSGQGIQGRPEEMEALARAIQQAAGNATQELGRTAAMFERMLNSGGWSDAKARATFERYNAVRQQLNRSLQEAQAIQAEIAGTAKRYKAAQGG